MAQEIEVKILNIEVSGLIEESRIFLNNEIDNARINFLGISKTRQESEDRAQLIKDFFKDK